MSTRDYDVIVIGAGHNGLVCAAYLAKAGLKVLILEQWHRVGGCVQTEELIPGFKINPCSVDHMLIQSTSIVQELELESRFGLKYLKADPTFSVPFPDGKYFIIYEDLDKTCKSIAKNISQKDAENYRNFVMFWYKGLEILNPLFHVPLYPLKDSLLKLSSRDRRNIFRLALKENDTFISIMRAVIMSPKLLLDNWFETEYVKAPIAWTACNFGLPPSQTGMGLMTSFPVFAHFSGTKRPEGGSGMLAQALASLIEHYGGKIKVNSLVKKIIVENNTAKGVILENGDAFKAPKVISAMSPKKLFVELIDEKALPEEFRKKIKNLEADQAAGIKLDLALDKLPVFAKNGGDPEITHGSPMICPSIEYLEKAYSDVKWGNPPKNPVFWGAVPTTLDPTLAPEGKHSLYLYGIAPKVLSNNRKWDDIKDGYADIMIDKMEEYIPDLRNLIIGRHIETPDDLQKRIGNTNAVHIDYFLDQNIIFRPTRKLSGYRTDIKGLYVSGSGTHPGGGVGGIPGRNAANVVLEDIRGKRSGNNFVQYGSVILDFISSLLSSKP